MRRSLVELESIVRKRICEVCNESLADCQCGLAEPASRALFRLFPHVAQAIQSVESDDIQEYISSIRQNVCAICTNQAGDGACLDSQQVRCAWDACPLPVVDASEAPGKMSKKRSRGPAAGFYSQPGLTNCLEITGGKR
jgi:hypothetical protein